MDMDENTKYCKNYNGIDLACIQCIEQAIFKIKSCYKAGKGGSKWEQ